METRRFDFKDFSQLQLACEEYNLDLNVSENYEVLKSSIQVGEQLVPNRMVIQPMEGFDSDDNGAPDELTFRRYERYARGGAGLIWFEAVAVLEEGRTNPHQLVLNEVTLPKFKELLGRTHQTARDSWGESHRPYTVLQLTHSGRFSKPSGQRQPIIAAHDSVFDKIVGIAEDYPVIDDQRLEYIQDYYVVAAQLAYEAGFDAVDIKACHRYLLSELLGAKNREGKYGGSYDNRTRFLKETLTRIRKEVPKIDLAVRLNATDVVCAKTSWGIQQISTNSCEIDLVETKSLVRELKELGVVLLNITAGTPYLNPHINRPYDQATLKGYPEPEHPLQGVARLLKLSEEVQKEIPDIPVVATGYSWLRQFGPAVAAWYVEQGRHQLIGFGRQAFAYPDLVKDLFEKGFIESKKCCITCSKCSQLMIWGSKTGCVVRDQLYLPVYKEQAEKHR